MFQLYFLTRVIRVIIVVSIFVRTLKYVFFLFHVVRIEFKDVTALMKCNCFPTLALAPAAKPRPVHSP